MNGSSSSDVGGTPYPPTAGDPYPDEGYAEDTFHGASATRDPGSGPRKKRSNVADPLINPKFAAPADRTKRAWWLLGATALVPGSAQLVAGRKGLGRLALRVTVTVWALILFSAVLWLVWKTALIWLLTNSITSWLLMFGLIGLAIGWVSLWFDTLRLIRPGLLGDKVRRAVVIVTVLAMLITGGGLGYAAHLVSVARGAVSNIFGGGLPFAPDNGRYNILLMGGDAGDDREGRRPDSMTVLSVDADSGRTVTVSLPRNLQNVPFPDDSPMNDVYPSGFSCGDECIMNAIYTDVMQNHQDRYPDVADPGAEATKDAAEGVTGLEIHGYVLIDMDGFESLVDALGGITLDVGGRVPMGGGTNMDTGLPNPILGWIEPGVQHMDGHHALWYARSREGATDYDRQARQRCVQAAMLKQLNPVNVATKFEDLANSGEEIIETDIPQSSIGSLVNVAMKAKNHDLESYAVGPPFYDQSFPTYPDFQLFQSDLQGVLDRATDDGADAAASSNVPARGVAGAPGGVGVGMSVPVPASPAMVTTAEELSPNGTCSVP